MTTEQVQKLAKEMFITTVKEVLDTTYFSDWFFDKMYIREGYDNISPHFDLLDKIQKELTEKIIEAIEEK